MSHLFLVLKVSRIKAIISQLTNNLLNYIKIVIIWNNVWNRLYAKLLPECPKAQFIIPIICPFVEVRMRQNSEQVIPCYYCVGSTEGWYSFKTSYCIENIHNKS